VDWASVAVTVLVLGAWLGIVRFVLPRFGIKGG